jgi:hypothetical protein
MLGRVFRPLSRYILACVCMCVYVCAVCAYVPFCLQKVFVAAKAYMNRCLHSFIAICVLFCLSCASVVSSSETGHEIMTSKCEQSEEQIRQFSEKKRETRETHNIVLQAIWLSSPTQRRTCRHPHHPLRKVNPLLQLALIARPTLPGRRAQPPALPLLLLRKGFRPRTCDLLLFCHSRTC